MQSGESVATCKDEVDHASAAQGAFLLAGPACQIDMSCAGRLQGLGGGFRLLRTSPDGTAVLTFGPKDTTLPGEQPYFMMTPRAVEPPQALERDRKRREDAKGVAELKALFDQLTPRERDVMALVTTGLMNKQIAGEMGVSEITVKIHRGHAMRKMRAKSLADLVRMAEALGVRRAKPASR